MIRNRLQLLREGTRVMSGASQAVEKVKVFFLISFSQTILLVKMF